jgi:aminomethyltransferase
MQADDFQSFLRTPLHDWHLAHHGRMVVFAGWRMPLHYAGGVIREHVATRTEAGLFDVSHMGRFHFGGSAARAFLARVLTADVPALTPARAQYTFIADPQGAAVDDAYLYCLQDDRYLLVVNAANRQRDWNWLQAQNPPGEVQFEDWGERLSMFALQGPGAQALLGSVAGGIALPQARNGVCTGNYRGRPLIVARTGYTGEAVGYELLVAAENALALWEQLVQAGAHPAGLGARDSLRLEAGLPLYGHELGVDREGNAIPIFANRIARFGVRMPDRGDYVGRQALDAQRVELEALTAGRIRSDAVRVLPRIVHPIAAFAERRPLRAGYDICMEQRPVGYLTSGSSVPLITEHGFAGAMRPIGLALLDSGIRYRPPPRLPLTAHDARGNAWRCELVERNLPPPAPE